MNAKTETKSRESEPSREDTLDEDDVVPDVAPVVAPPVVDPAASATLDRAAAASAQLAALGAAANRVAGAEGRSGANPEPSTAPGEAAGEAPTSDADVPLDTTFEDAAQSNESADANTPDVPERERPTERRVDSQSQTAAVNELGAKTRVEEPIALRTLDAAALTASNDRAARVLDQIRVFVQPGMRSASLELSPAHLGRIDVKLNFSAGELAAHLVVEAVETYEALQRHMPELRASLERGGLDVGSLELTLATRDDSTPRDERGQSTNTDTRPSARAHDERDRRVVETIWQRPNTVTNDRVDTLA